MAGISPSMLHPVLCERLRADRPHVVTVGASKLAAASLTATAHHSLQLPRCHLRTSAVRLAYSADWKKQLNSDHSPLLIHAHCLAVLQMCTVHVHQM